MISYREKELMMVMKFLLDHANEFAQSTKLVSDEIEFGDSLGEKIQMLPEIDSYEKLVELVRNSGYDTTVRINDILSEKELKQLEKEYKDIEDNFIKLTGLKKIDVIFIVIAVTLQMVRQVLQPKVNFDAFKVMENRDSHDKAADAAKESGYNKDRAEKKKNEAEQDDTKGFRYYHAKLEEVSDVTHVPYDVINGTKKFDVKLSGKNHRVKTLGHDPWLGYLFGTCNILTNTMSLGKDNQFRTLHIAKDEQGKPSAVAEANIEKMIEYSIKRYNESKATFVLALIKQSYHIKSDEYSKEGLSLPFMQLFFESDVIQELCESGVDYSKLEFLGTVVEQTVLTEMISYIISITHRITIICEENKQNCSERVITKEELIQSLKKRKTLNEVRTRKVIIISESIASLANALIIGGMEIGAAVTENGKLAKEAMKNIDLGGYLSTVIHLITDVRFISKVKKEFIAKAIEYNYEKKLDELNI